MLETLLKSPQRAPKERRRGGLILLILILLVAGAMFSAGGWWTWAAGASGPQDKIVVVIPQGATGAEVAELLEGKGVIRSTFTFKLMSRFRGFGGGFEAGTYTTLSTNMSVSDALAALKDGPLPKETLSVVFAEGLNVAQTAAEIQDQIGIPRQDFISAAQSGRFSLPPYLPKGTRTVEGFLFPKKYDFFAGVTANEVIERLLAQFQSEVEGLPWNRIKSFGLKNRYEVVIVASMIEREARFPEDRPKIARVIYNRLTKGMPLQIDATVQYALNKYRPLLLEDLRVQSPYNTYLHNGLPPTPIASPGIASLEAALAPANGNWIYYLVCDDQGHHVFTPSYDQFVQLKANPTCEA